MNYAIDFIDSAAKIQKDFIAKILPEKQYREPIEKATDFVVSIQKTNLSLIDNYTKEIVNSFNKMYYDAAFKK